MLGFRVHRSTRRWCSADALTRCTLSQIAPSAAQGDRERAVRLTACHPTESVYNSDRSNHNPYSIPDRRAAQAAARIRQACLIAHIGA